MNIVESAPLQASLGESPLWCCRSQTLWMVDIRAPAVLQFNPKNSDFKRYVMPDLTGMVAFAESGLLVGVRRSIHLLDQQTSNLGKALAEFDDDCPDNRINDSKVSPDGSLWCGTMAHSELSATGSLYRYSASSGIQRLRTDVTIPNALCFTPDGKSVFFADTIKGVILKADLTSSTLEFEIFAAADVAPGSPDGSCIDAKGYIWNARYGGSCVVRINPQGEVDKLIELPISQPTCCALGGKDMKTLYITTASQNLDAAALNDQPLAGDLFMIDVDVPGLPEPVFAG